MQSKNTNVKSLETTVPNFFTLSLELIEPFHKMTSKEMDIMAVLLYKRHLLKTKLGNDEYVDQLLLNNDTRKEIKTRMGYTTNQVVSNSLHDLRAKKVLNGNKISKYIIPNIEREATNFKLIFNFNINEAR